MVCLYVVLGLFFRALFGTNWPVLALLFTDFFAGILPHLLSAMGLRPAVWLAPSLSPPRSTAQGGGESIRPLLMSHYIITLYLYFVIDIQAGREYPSQA